MIFSSPDPDVVLPEVDIYQYFISNPRNVDPSTVIYIDAATGKTLTFGDIGIQTRLFAAGLQDTFDFKPKDVVALYSCNQYDFAIPIFGTLCAGGIITTVNHAYTVDELAFQLQDSGAKYIITTEDLIPNASAAAERCGISPDAILLFGQPAQGKKSYTSLLQHRQATPVTSDMEDLAYLCYSSGTTGKSKGVMLTHRNITANIVQCIGFDQLIYDYEKDVNILGFLPLYHIYGLMNLLHVPLVTGCTVYIMSKFDLPSFLKYIQNYKITYTFLVPPVALALAKHPIVDNFDLSSLRLISCGAAPLPKDLCGMILERLNVYCRQGFGMTEASPIVSCLRPNQRLDGSIGPLVCNLKAKFVDHEGKELGPNEQGELMLFGPNVMKGYLNNEEANKVTFDADGWMHTGDIGYIDENGFIFVVDRLKELIKMKGFQVAPAELEALLQTHPKILDCAVIPAYDHSQATEIPRAYVVVRPGVTEDDELKKDIIEFVASRAANHKRLRGGVVFTSVIPKTASGKILRKDIVKLDRETNPTNVL